MHHISNQREHWSRASLAVQWLRLHTSTPGGMGSILGQETKILNASWPKKEHWVKLFVGYNPIFIFSVYTYT